MKILMLTPYLPYPLLSGGQIRSYHLIRQMAQKHEITLFSLIKDESEKEYLPELKKYCKEVRVFKRSQKPFTFKNIVKAGLNTFTKQDYPFVVIRNFSKEAYEAVQNELANHEYDLIHAETFYMMPHIPKTEIPTILVEQTIEYLGYESFAERFSKAIKFFLKPLFNLDIEKIKKWEHFYWRSCDLLVTMSEEDKKFISRELPKKRSIEVVANGVDIDFFLEKKKQKEFKQPTVLFVGTFKWLPNVEAAEYLAEKVWPLIRQKLPKAKLWIVGNAPTQEIYNLAKENSGIEITGGIPDIRDAYAGAQILCAPVFSGKGTRYKILEAMATATPIVATTTAVEGLSLKDGEQVLIVDSAEGLAAKCVSLLENNDLQSKLSRAGQEFVIKNYDWQTIGQKLDKVYREVGKCNKREKVKNGERND